MEDPGGVAEVRIVQALRELGLSGILEPHAPEQDLDSLDIVAIAVAFEEHNIVHLGQLVVSASPRSSTELRDLLASGMTRQRSPGTDDE